jgi:hypothetical protein
MRVYTTPGADWSGRGHGFRMARDQYVVDGPDTVLSFAGILPYPAHVTVSNMTTGLDLSPDHNYQVNWATQQISVTSGAAEDDVLVVRVYELGGGNQRFRQIYSGSEIQPSIVIPVQYSLIQNLVIFVNGVPTNNYRYRSAPSNTTEVIFDAPGLSSSDFVLIMANGPTTVNNTTVAYNWSTPQTQQFVSAGELSYTLDNSLIYSNPDTAIITVNGCRARSSAGVSYRADGSVGYQLPVRIGVSQSSIPDVDVRVYINDIPQISNVDYGVEPWDGESTREVIFVNPPSSGQRVTIYVTTGSQAYIANGRLQFNPAGGLVPIPGDIVSVTTWNDTRQQSLLTQVYVGPTAVTVTTQEAYDSTNFDAGDVSNDPGSFDYAEGKIVVVNQLLLDQPVSDPDRLWVTLNGLRLYSGQDFNVVEQEIVLLSGQILKATDVVVITEFTDSVVPDAAAFRIFQDMRGVQETYRITADTTTNLTQTLAATDDVIHVQDASALHQPNLSYVGNTWGVLTVNGERIMYRERDIETDTVSSLLRGTSGTGAADHAAGSAVYDMSRGNRLSAQYQDRVLGNITNPLESGVNLGDGVTRTFVAETIDLSQDDSTSLADAVEVYVGGTHLLTGFEVVGEDPVTVEFDTAPPPGVEVAILVRQGVTWYAPGPDTASNGVALQDTNTPAARFLCGN